MTEDFLHYLWKFRLLEGPMCTVSGDHIAVFHPGEHNRDAGPDFLNARLRIGDTTWAGNVEMHMRSSDWIRHNHQTDRAYDNVILHVVLEDDLEKPNGSLQRIPVLEIREQVPVSVYERYEDLLHNRNWIPCERLIGGLDPFCFGQWSQALVVERLEEKSRRFRQILESCRYDWDEAFFRHLARAFGFRINSVPFESLARSTPFRILLRHRDNLFQLESLLFGQAGMLEQDFTGKYPKQLKQEYRFLREKYSLSPVEGSLWKFLRLRPSNFPTIRIAQLAMLLHRFGKLTDLIIQEETLAGLLEKLTVPVTDYWFDHYVFDKPSRHRHKMMGHSSVQLLVLNLAIPFLFHYGDEKGIPAYREKGLQLLEELPGEVNAETIRFAGLGLPVSRADQTQALLQLKNKYCNRKRCLECRIGKELLTR
jgi:hypothetical protein